MTEPTVAGTDLGSNALRSALVDRIRERDVRIPYVERAFLARQLGLGRDDLLSLDDHVIGALTNIPTSVMNVIGAERLLEAIDAAVAREHPVDMEYHGPVTTATVPIGDDDSARLVLEDGAIYVPRVTDDVTEAFPLELSPDDAEAVAYALLRLVEYARGEEKT